MPSGSPGWEPGNCRRPIHPYWDQLINGSLDTEFVEMEGIVTTVRADGVTLLTHGGKIKVQVLWRERRHEQRRVETVRRRAHPAAGLFVCVVGCDTHEVNVSEIRMFAPAVTVVEPAPADAFAVTPKRVADLLQFDPQASALRQVKVSGQIVTERGGEYYAMDGTNGFRFILKEHASLGAGDLVEVVGFPSLTGPSPVLQEALRAKDRRRPRARTPARWMPTICSGPKTTPSACASRPCC